MIIERYLYREVAQTFLGVLSVLLLILVSQRFVVYLAQAAAGSLASDVILQLLALKLASSLVLVLPLAFYVAVLLGFGRLYQDSEVTAMTAGGVGVARMLQAVLLFSVGFAAVGLALSLYVSPKATALSDAIKVRAAQSSDIAGLVAGRFKELSGGDRVFYAEGISPDRQDLRNVFVQIHDRSPPLLLASAGGYQYVDEATGDHFLVLVDGNRYEGEAGMASYTITHFQTHAVRIQRRQADDRAQQTAAIPTAELLGSDIPRWTAELQWRLSRRIGPMDVSNRSYRSCS